MAEVEPGQAMQRAMLLRCGQWRRLHRTTLRCEGGRSAVLVVVGVSGAGGMTGT